MTHSKALKTMIDELPYTPRLATPQEFDSIVLSGNYCPDAQGISSIPKVAILTRAWWIYYAPAETGEDPNQLFDDWLSFAENELKLPIATVEAIDKVLNNY